MVSESEQVFAGVVRHEHLRCHASRNLLEIVNDVEVGTHVAIERA